MPNVTKLDSNIDFDSETEIAGSDSHHKPRRRHSSTGRHNSYRHKYLWLIIGASWCALILLFLYFNWIISVLNAENKSYKYELTQAQHTIEEIQPQLESTKQQIAELLEGKLPDIDTIEFDKVLNLDDGYIKNIVFTQLKKRNQTTYEYKIVLQNSSLSAIRPLVDILMFDEKGIQIGASEMGRTNDSYDSEKDKYLEVGETRSHSSEIKLIRPGEPKYYLIVRDFNLPE
jgi:hypothetical protein